MSEVPLYFQAELGSGLPLEPFRPETSKKSRFLIVHLRRAQVRKSAQFPARSTLLFHRE